MNILNANTETILRPTCAITGATKLRIREALHTLLGPTVYLEANQVGQQINKGCHENRAKMTKRCTSTSNSVLLAKNNNTGIQQTE